jgi:hypothetical protein
MSAIHFRGGFLLGAPANIRKYPVKHGTAEPATGEVQVKTPDDQAKDSWSSFFSTVGKDFAEDPSKLRTALKEAAEALGGGLRSVEDPAGIALSIWIPGNITNDQIRTEFVSRLLPLGLDVDRALIGVANIGQRIEEAAGEVSNRRFDVVIPAEGYTLDKTGMFVAVTSEAQATEKLRRSIVDRDEALSQVREQKRDQILEELETRRLDREAARRVEEAERALAEERERSAKLTEESARLAAELAALKEQYVQATGEKPAEIIPPEQETEEELPKAKPVKVKPTKLNKAQREAIEAERIAKERRVRKNEQARIRRAKAQREAIEAEERRVRKNEQARIRRAEARRESIEAEERRVKKNEQARIRRAVKKAKPVKVAKKTTTKKKTTRSTR